MSERHERRSTEAAAARKVLRHEPDQSTAVDLHDDDLAEPHDARRTRDRVALHARRPA